MRKELFVLLFIGLILPSCKKYISVDSPLPVETRSSVFISTNNNNIISYNAKTGEKVWEAALKGTNEGVPVLYDNTVYLYTTNGYLYGINAHTGKIRLEKNLNYAPIPTVSTQPSLCVYTNKIYIANKRLYCVDTFGAAIWNYNPGENCTTSPTFANGKIIVGVGDEIHAVNSSTGAFIWSSTAIAQLSPNDIITSSPRVSGGMVYFGADNKKVYAIKELDGTSVWEYTTGDKVLSSPMVYGGMCILGSQDFDIHCIDTTTGLKRWVFPTNERIFSSPSIHELTNTVLIGSYDFNLYAIDHVSGSLKWKYPTGSLIKSSPVVFENFVYFTSFDRYLYCVDIRDGSLVWKQFLDGNSESSPLIDDLDAGTIFGRSPSISGMSQY